MQNPKEKPPNLGIDIASGIGWFAAVIVIASAIVAIPLTSGLNSFLIAFFAVIVVIITYFFARHFKRNYPNSDLLSAVKKQAEGPREAPDLAENSSELSSDDDVIPPDFDHLSIDREIFEPFVSEIKQDQDIVSPSDFEWFEPYMLACKTVWERSPGARRKQIQRAAFDEIKNECPAIFTASASALEGYISLGKSKSYHMVRVRAWEVKQRANKNGDLQ